MAAKNLLAQQMFCLLVNWSILIYLYKLVFKHVTDAIMSTLLNPDQRSVLGIDLLQGSLKLALIHPQILSISQHLRYASCNLARFNCNHCNYFFSTLMILNNHITNRHLAFAMLVLNSTVLAFNLKI